MFVPPNAGLGVKIGNTYVNGKSNKGKGKGKGTSGTSNSGEHQRQDHAAAPNQDDPLQRLAEALKAVTTPQRKPAQGFQTPSTSSEKNGSKTSDTSSALSDMDKNKNHADVEDGEDGPDAAYRRWRERKTNNWEGDHAERPAYPRRARQSATEAKWGKPQWYLSARCFQDEGVDGSIQLQGDVDTSYGRCEHDWAGIHLRHHPVSSMMECTKSLLDESCQLRILAMAFTPKEVKWLNEEGKVVIVNGHKDSYSDINRILQKYYWSFPYDTNGAEFEAMVDDYARRRGLQTSDQAVGPDEDDLAKMRKEMEKAQDERAALQNEVQRMHNQMLTMMNQMTGAAAGNMQGFFQEAERNQDAQNMMSGARPPHQAQDQQPYPVVQKDLGTSVWAAPSMPTGLTQDSPTDDTPPPGPAPKALWKKTTTKADDPAEGWKGLQKAGPKNTLSPEKKGAKDPKATKTVKTNKRHLTRASCKEMKMGEDREQDMDLNDLTEPQLAFGTQPWFPPEGDDDSECL